MTKKPIVGIIGGSRVTPEVARWAWEVGRLLGKDGHTIVCGGLSGVMEEVSRGCSEAGGTVIGILPGFSKKDANPYVDIPIVTGMSNARNVLIVRTADVCIAIDGSYGTLSEVGLALNVGTPVVSLKSWDVTRAGEVEPEMFARVQSPKEAVKMALEIASKEHKPAQTLV